VGQTRIKPPRRCSAAMRGEFEMWFLSYPRSFPRTRRIGKAASLRAYMRARLHASAALLLNSVHIFRLRSDPAFILTPVSWLKGEHWHIESNRLPARSAP
jgi:hypothetical protein